MSDEEVAERDGTGARQFGEEIIEPGEPFTGETLDTIRALIADSPDVGVTATGDTHPEETANGRFEPGVSGQSHGHDAVEAPRDARESVPSEEAEPAPARVRRAWRRLEIVEGAPGQLVRHVMSSPRWIALMILASVFLWRPWFIPALVFVIVFALLLIGVLIGQDRLGRIMIYVLKRYIWADPARGAALQSFLPARWHPFLYKPLGDEDAWEGPVDPTFAARLARMR